MTACAGCGKEFDTSELVEPEQLCASCSNPDLAEDDSFMFEEGRDGRLVGAMHSAVLRAMAARKVVPQLVPVYAARIPTELKKGRGN